MSRRMFSAFLAMCACAVVAQSASAQISEPFDTTAVGLLPAGWTSTTTGAGAVWITKNDQSYSPANSVFTNDVATVSSQFLVLPTITAAGPITLSLWHFYTTEAGFDGWTVEASVNSGPFVNIGQSAWTVGGYNATISGAWQSPIANQRAFSGAAAAWQNSIALIPATGGSQVTLRIRMASDSSLSSTGVWIDDVTVTSAAPAVPSGTPSANPTPVPQGASTELTIGVTPGGGGSLNDIANPPQLSGVRVDVSSVSGNSPPDWLYLVRDGITANWKSTLAIPVTLAPAPYMLPYEITQTGTSPGTGSGTIDLTVIVPPPTNDLCANPIQLFDGTPYSGDNTNATSTGDGVAGTGCPAGNSGLWFTFTSSAAGGAHVFSTCGTGFDTVLTVFQAGVTCAGITSATNVLACNDDNGPACTGTAASIQTTLAPSSTYLVRFSSYSATIQGPFTLLVTAPSPIDACCNNATGVCTPIVVGTCPAGTTSTGATSCTPTPCTASVCCNDLTGACTIVYVVGCPSGTTPSMATTCAPGACPASGSCCTGTTCTQLLAADSASCSGVFTLNAACTPNACLPNDACSGAIAMTVGNTYSTASPGTDATADAYDTCSLGTTTPYGVWYTYTTGVEAGVFNYSEIGTHDIIVQVFTGPCNALVPVSCSDAETNINITMAANTTYTFLLGMWSDTTTPTSSYDLSANSFTPVTGACCNGTTCSSGVTASACSGLWLGANSVCGLLPTHSSGAINATIPDASLTPGTNVLNVAGDPATITDLKVIVSINHTFVGDVLLQLTGPNGTTLNLMSRANGNLNCDPPVIGFAGSGNDLSGTYIFDDAAPTNFNVAAAAGGTPVAQDSYKASDCSGADVALSAPSPAGFGGISANGAWTLTFYDLATLDQGTVASWGIIVNNMTTSTCDNVGACCNGSSCSLALNAGACAGSFQGAGSSCSPSPCIMSSTNCCRGTTCNPVAAGTCTGFVAGSQSLVVGSCGAGNTLATCCFADYNHDGIQSIDDLFLYFNAYFTGSPWANVGGDGVATPTIDDLFLYINAYFSTCL